MSLRLFINTLALGLTTLFSFGTAANESLTCHRGFNLPEIRQLITVFDSSHELSVTEFVTIYPDRQRILSLNIAYQGKLIDELPIENHVITNPNSFNFKFWVKVNKNLVRANDLVQALGPEVHREVSLLASGDISNEPCQGSHSDLFNGISVGEEIPALDLEVAILNQVTGRWDNNGGLNFKVHLDAQLLN